MPKYIPRVGDRVAFYTHGLREEMTVEKVEANIIRGSGKSTVPALVVEVIERGA